jgi:hypothetical protein
VSLVPLKEEERLQSTIDNERRKKQYKISQHNTTHHKTMQNNTQHNAILNTEQHSNLISHYQWLQMRFKVRAIS